MAVNVLFKEIVIADLASEAIQEGKLMWVTDTYEIYFDIDATTRIRMYDGAMGSLADEYDPLLTYTLGSLVIYHGLLYKNTTAIVTPEAWDINHWTSVNLEDLMGKLGDLTTTTKTNIIAAINELDGDIGDLTSLNTTEKGSLVGAVNEVNTSLTNSHTVYPYNSSTGYSTENLKMECGYIEITGTQGTYLSQVITFKNTYTYVPSVMVNSWTAEPNSQANIGSTSPSTTQVTIYCKNDAGTLSRINYLVIGI